MKHNEKKITLNYAITMIIFVLLFTSVFYFVAKQVTSQDLLSFDKTIISFVQSFISDRLTKWVLKLTELGSARFISIVLIIISFLLIRRKKYSLAIFIIATNGIGALLNKLLKWFFKRERPDILPVIMEKGFSFPSGHSMGSIIFYGSIAFITIYLVHSTWGKMVSCLVLSITILLIGVSRIYLGVHYPTDVVGGFSIGLAFLVLCILVYRYYIERRLAKKK